MTFIIGVCSLQSSVLLFDNNLGKQIAIADDQPAAATLCSFISIVSAMNRV
jgi:hypothetical protein